MNADQFTLTNDPPRPTFWKAPAPEKKKQRSLFSGLNCLAGQEDLFPDIDNPPEPKRMPRFMSFMLTTQQIMDETKTETRRLDTWGDMKAGEVFYGVEKGMGLKKGEKVNKLKLLRCVSNHAEPLNAITAEGVSREGYPGESPEFFIEKFCKFAKCKPETPVNVIRFEYVRESAET